MTEQPTEQRATITIPIDHPGIFRDDDEYDYQGECPVATAGSTHQTHITIGHSECPGCDAVFDTYLHRVNGKAESLIVQW